MIKIQAKKSLGQNFLKSEAALASIVACSELSGESVVLEIGPGTGILTERILATEAKVIAIEKDDRLIELLTEKFASFIDQDKFTLVHADIMEIDIQTLMEQEGAKDFKLVANIPYYLTGAIMRKFIDENLASSMTLLVQDEVAKRVVCRDGKESLLSLSVESYGKAKYVKKVLAGSFVPAPNVDSAIIYIKRDDISIFKNPNEREVFFKLIHAGFAHKRKTLMHNLKINMETNWPNIVQTFETLNIDIKIRAEDVNMGSWMRIVHAII
jgi:16S rRNA (adenine1518-N6/adenine1519-N6)-dimethyltransferase